MTVPVGGVDVSRETFTDLQYFAKLVEKWTPKINLVARGSIDSLWDRHIADSVQIWRHAPKSFEKWVDIGSGGGFPGIVVAILGKTQSPEATFTLIESDQRKATFLRTASRELGLAVTVISERIEDAPPQSADIVSARALAPLSGLLDLVDRHLKLDGCALLHKGKQARQEVAEARESWSFLLEEHPSFTDPDARLLAIQRISRRG